MGRSSSLTKAIRSKRIVNSMRKKILAMPHAQAHKKVRMEMTREGGPNEPGVSGRFSLSP